MDGPDDWSDYKRNADRVSATIAALAAETQEQRSRREWEQSEAARAERAARLPDDPWAGFQIDPLPQPNADQDPTPASRNLPPRTAEEYAAAENPPMPFKRASDLDGKPVPERRWLVDGLIPMGKVTLLGGDGGTGKSLLALQLAAAVATGGDWIGRGVTAGAAAYLSAEDDDDEMERRIDDVARSEGLRKADLRCLTYISLAGQDATLAMIEGTTGKLHPSPRMAQLHRWLAAEKPSLVVLDTLADLFPGNENDRVQARQFVGMLARIAIKYQCAVVLLAHPSLSGLNTGSGTSGSTGWNNSVRSRLYFERVRQDDYEANPDARVLRTMKANHGRIGGEISVTWRDGVFIADATETGLDRMATGAKAERVFLKLLRLFNEQGRRVNSAGGPTYAAKMFAEHPDAEGIKKTAFRSAMDVLLGKGVIAIGHCGPPSKQVTYLYEVVK